MTRIRRITVHANPSSLSIIYAKINSAIFAIIHVAALWGCDGKKKKKNPVIAVLYITLYVQVAGRK